MEAKANSAISRFGMLDHGDAVVVGVSGGADSMALLHLLYTLTPEYDLKLIVCHVNHGIRGEEALRDERLVTDYCAQLGIACEAVHVDVPALAQQKGLSIEECGRGVRYETFERLARPSGAKIATAHTLSDSLETMLFHLARGTGLRGLCGIPPVRGNIIRPLIDVTREEVEGYCARHNIPYITDSTNFLPDYTRNRIRGEVVPPLLSIHPAGAQAIGRTINAIREDERYLSELADEALRQSVLFDGFDAARLCSLPSSLRARAVASILRQHSVSVRAGFIEKLSLMLCEEKAAITLTAGVSARIERGVLRIERQCNADLPDYLVPLSEGVCTLFDKTQVEVKTMRDSDEDCLKKIHPKLLKNMLDYDSIIGTAYFRPRREGDSIRLFGRGCTKKLKKLMNEQGVLPAQRAYVPVLADEQGVIWVHGFGCAERVAPSPQTRSVTVIAIHSEA